MNEVEAVARAIAPSRWEVMDHYLAQTKRKYDGENDAYDPDNFKDRESMATAQAAIAALDAARGDAEPVAWLYGAPRRAPFKGFEARASHSRWPDWMQTGWTETPLYAHPTRGDQVARKDRPMTTENWTFRLGDRVTKTKGSSWTGRVVGFYSTTLTPEGYAVESENERGSVQIYPGKFLKEVGDATS